MESFLATNENNWARETSSTTATDTHMTCTSCAKILPSQAFPKNKNKCKDCYNQYQKDLRLKNKEKQRQGQSTEQVGQISAYLSQLEYQQNLIQELRHENAQLRAYNIALQEARVNMAHLNNMLSQIYMTLMSQKSNISSHPTETYKPEIVYRLTFNIINIII